MSSTRGSGESPYTRCAETCMETCIIFIHVAVCVRACVRVCMCRSDCECIHAFVHCMTLHCPPICDPLHTSKQAPPPHAPPHMPASATPPPTTRPQAGVGMASLTTRAISGASADQRAGRAGRLGPGTAVRLWTETEQGRLKPDTAPEISLSDLAPMLLQIAAWGGALSPCASPGPQPTP
jgi:hypothetical protein